MLRRDHAGFQPIFGLQHPIAELPQLVANQLPHARIVFGDAAVFLDCRSLDADVIPLGFAEAGLSLLLGVGPPDTLELLRRFEEKLARLRAERLRQPVMWPVVLGVRSEHSDASERPGLSWARRAGGR